MWPRTGGVEARTESLGNRNGVVGWLARLRPAGEFAITSGTLGSTAAQTVMVAVFPVLLAEYAPSAFMLGLVIGGEGALALVVPYWIGLLSDRLPADLARRFGRRALFLLTTAPLLAATVAVVPFVSGYWRLAAVAFVFFAALHAYLTPLWALMIDAVPATRWGRVQGVRGVFHSAGLAYGLVAGGLLFSLWPPLPFLLCAALVLSTTASTLAASRALAADHYAGEPEPAAEGSRSPDIASFDPHGTRRRLSPDLRAAIPGRVARGARGNGGSAPQWFLVGNALWTASVDGIRPYIFLYAIAVLGIGVSQMSLLLLLLVLGLAVGSAILGWLGDRIDRGRLLMIGAVVTGTAILPGVFVRDLWTAIPLLTVAGIGAAAIMTLPFPVYAGLVGERSMGRRTGMYVVSLGAGRMIAPMVIGAGIDRGAHWFPGEAGYPLIWPVAGVLMLAGAFALKQALAQAARG